MTQIIERPVYQGQFGEFTITPEDLRGVAIYRTGLAIAALCFGIATYLVIFGGNIHQVAPFITMLFIGFYAALGVSLFTIHIYLIPLHRLLQIFWLVGGVAAFAIALKVPQPLALTIYENPLTLLGIGFTFAALTGIYFKEAFCFNRLETKLLTPLVPALLLGHIVGLWPVEVERILLAAWAVLFAIFAVRKVLQQMPPDIGDKSVFTYLKQQH